MKRTMLVVVGAGASVKANVPGASELLEPVLEALPTIVVPGTAFSSARYPDSIHGPYDRRVRVADLLSSAILAQNGRIDFELVLRSIESLLSYTALPIVSYTQPKPEFARLLDWSVLSQAHDAATKAVRNAIVQREPPKPEQIEARDNVRFLFQELAKDFRLILSTLNYDDLLDDTLTWSDGFYEAGSSDYALFDPLRWRETEISSEHLMMHIHGSVRFGFRKGDDLIRGGARFDEPARYPDAEKAAASTEGTYTSPRSVDGQDLIGGTIIAGGDKGARLVFNMRPYGYYFSTLQHSIPDADCMLIVGYGWNDEHVTQLIQEYADIHPDRKIAVITRRSGRDLGKNTKKDTILRQLGKTEWAKIENLTYEPFGAGSTPNWTHRAAGRLYVVTTGMPLKQDEVDAVLTFLRKP